MDSHPEVNCESIVGLSFEIEDIIVETLPMLSMHISAKSKMAPFRVSEWEIRRWAEEIVHDVSPLHVQVSISEGAGDIRVLFVNISELLRFDKAVGKRPHHAIGNVPITVQINPAPLTVSYDDKAWIKSRSLWIKAVPNKLFGISDASSILSPDDKAWKMLSRISGDKIERIEVIRPASDAADIAITFTSSICVRFTSFTACRKAYAVLTESRLLTGKQKSCLVARRAPRDTSQNLMTCDTGVSATSMGKLHIMDVHPDVDGYLRKQNIHHRQRAQHKEQAAREAFMTQAQQAKVDIEACTCRLEEECDKWRSEGFSCIESCSPEGESIRATAKSVRHAVDETRVIVERYVKEVQCSADDGQATANHTARIWQCREDVSSAVQRLRLSLEEFCLHSAVRWEGICQQRQDMEKLRKVKETEEVVGAAVNSLERWQDELNDLDAFMTRCSTSNKHLPPPPEAETAAVPSCFGSGFSRGHHLAWMDVCAEAVSKTSKPLRALQTTLKRLLAKFDKTSTASTAERYSLMESIKTCMQMRALEWTKASVVMKAWRAMVDVLEDMSYAILAAENILLKLPSSPQSTKAQDTMTTAARVSDSTCSTREIVALVLRLTRACITCVYSYGHGKGSESPSPPPPVHLSLLESVYPTLYAILRPLETYLIPTEHLLQRSRHSCLPPPRVHSPHNCPSHDTHARCSAPAINVMEVDASRVELRQAVHRTDYRLARVGVMARVALEPLLEELLQAGSEDTNSINRTSKTRILTTTMTTYASNSPGDGGGCSIGSSDDAFANACAVSGLELLSAWETFETSLMHAEDDLATAIRDVHIREENCRLRNVTHMGLEDERSEVVRSIEYLQARERSLLEVLRKREKACGRGEGDRNREGRAAVAGGVYTKRCVRWEDVWRASVNVWERGGEVVDGVCVQVPPWWCDEGRDESLSAATEDVGGEGVVGMDLYADCGQTQRRRKRSRVGGGGRGRSLSNKDGAADVAAGGATKRLRSVLATAPEQCFVTANKSATVVSSTIGERSVDDRSRGVVNGAGTGESKPSEGLLREQLLRAKLVHKRGMGVQ